MAPCNAMFLDDSNRHTIPAVTYAIERKTEALGLDYEVDHRIGALIRMLATSKTAGRFLELGTGTGFYTAWLLNGMDDFSNLDSVENDPQALSVASELLGFDHRVQFFQQDARAFIAQAAHAAYDLILSDTWIGKYECLIETLLLLKQGGLYVVDHVDEDALEWPEDKLPIVKRFRDSLILRSDLQVVTLKWSSGIMIAAKKAV